MWEQVDADVPFDPSEGTKAAERGDGGPGVFGNVEDV